MYLNCHSYFSLRYGTLSPQELVAQAARLGIRQLALTDINGVSGVFDFVRACLEAGIQPVVGAEVRTHGKLQYMLLARTPLGFAEINRHLSLYLLAEKAFPLRAPHLSEARVIYPLHRLDTLGELGPHEYVGVRAGELSQLWRYRNKVKPEQMLAWVPVTYADRTGFALHRLLRAIDHNCLLSRLAEHETIRDNEYPLPPETIRAVYSGYPFLTENAQRLLEGCHFHVDFDSSKNRRLFTPSREDDAALLRKLAEDGLRDRYGSDALARQRVEKELSIIDNLGFTSYFLITWDIIRYARSRGYFHVGRGSGANSIVAYCMGITDIDPIELDLYFERFINPHRSSPPDFDIDFSWDERDEIIDYVFKKWGRHHVCLLATYSTFRDRAAYRELGKVFGLPKAEIDALVADPAGTPPGEYTKYILRFAPLLEEFPNHLGIHAGGILIAEEPLYHYTALQMMPKGFPICQWDMYVAEDIGFAKWDVLSQRGLGHIKEAVDWVRRNRQVSVDIHRIQDFKGDPAIRRQLLDHETMGCFYIESPAMRGLMAKLGCSDYLTLVAASSIIRPGVASSGMMREYIRRHHNPAQTQHLHPDLGELLADTYGVMIYQEDVIKVAHHFAGLSLAEADSLRRAMSGKYRSKAEFARIEQRFFESCRERGYEREVTLELWRQMLSFAGYSFSKAHSASFAVESYQSLYLKAHYPLEFMTAVINNFGGFYRTEFYVHEARRSGAGIEAPDVNRSDWLTRIEGQTLWLGWSLVKSREGGTVSRLLEQRAAGGPYRDLEDFYRRVGAGLTQLIILIRIGAFRGFGASKKELLWQAHALLGGPRIEALTGDLFPLEEIRYALPPLADDPLEDAYDELELLGFPLCSPFAMLAEPTMGIPSRSLPDYAGQTVQLDGYLVTYKPVRTKNGTMMQFGYFLDAWGQFFDTVHFPPVVMQYPLRGRGVYRIWGKVVLEFGFPSVEVQRLEKLALRPDPRTAGGGMIGQLNQPSAA